MKAVLFDLFGTLVPNLPPELWTESCRLISGTLGIPEDEYTRIWSEKFEDRMTGKILDGPEQFDDILQKLDHQVSDEIKSAAYQIHRDLLARALQPKHDAVQTLTQLRDNGLLLALVTDCSSSAPEILDQTPLGDFFPHKSSSAHLGTRKPDPKMYQHVLNLLEIDAADALYVGDGNSHELPGAKSMGMTTVWVDNGIQQYWRERYDPSADHTIQDLKELITLLDKFNA